MSQRAADLSAVAIGVDGGVGSLKFVIEKPGGGREFHECAGANPTLIGMEEFRSRLSQAIHDALGRAGCSAANVRSAGFALSGVDRIEEIDRLKQVLSQRVLTACPRIWVGNDALAALRLGAGELEGIVLIAGTGSICFAVDKNGQSLRVGGWGGELGDEGSAFWIGQRALHAVCRMADGRARRTRLLDRVLQKLGLNRAEELIPWPASLTREQFKQAAASLFPLVADCAASGDESAARILEAAIVHLAQLAKTGRRRLKLLERRRLLGADTQHEEPDTIIDDDMLRSDAEEAGEKDEPMKLVCSGGLFSGSEKFYRDFVSELERRGANLTPVRLTEPASLGALELGREAEPA